MYISVFVVGLPSIAHMSRKCENLIYFSVWFFIYYNVLVIIYCFSEGKSNRKLENNNRIEYMWNGRDRLNILGGAGEARVGGTWRGCKCRKYTDFQFFISQIVAGWICQPFECLVSLKSFHVSLRIHELL